MINLCPVCIITAGMGDEFHIFEQKINSQFINFAKLEFGDGFNEIEHKWWTVIDAQCDENYRDYISEKRIPISRAIAGTYNTQRFVFMYVSRLEQLSLIEKVHKELASLQESNKILPGVVDVFHYGLLYYKKDEVVAKPASIEKLAKKLDVLVLPSDINFHYSLNKYGYKELPEANEQLFDSLAQLIFHIGLTVHTLSLCKEIPGQNLMTAGAYSLTFEPDVYKHNYATSILRLAFYNFATSESKEWFDKHQADIYFEASDIKQNWSWDYLYKFLIADFETENIIKKRNNELCKILSNPPVSPWYLFSRWLLPVYFKKFLKSLVVNLRDTAHNFVFGTGLGYASHLSSKYKEIQNKDNPKSKEAISIFLKNFWASNTSQDKPVGLQNLVYLNKKLGEFFENQRKIIEEVLNSKTPASKEFPKLEDYPLKQIPSSISEYYQDCINNPQSKGSGDNETDDKSDEDSLFPKLMRLLQFHPVPLSLFIRSVILGLCIPIVIIAFLKAFNDKLLNTTYFEYGVGSLILFGTLFTLTFGAAFYKYSIKVLKKRRNLIKEYLGWVFYKVQRHLSNSTLEFQLEYYNELKDECKRIETNLNNLIDTRVKNDSPDFPDRDLKFHQHMFQRDLLGKFDDLIPILSLQHFPVEITSHNKVFGHDQLTSKDQAILFKSIFLEVPQSGVPPYSLLFENLHTSNTSLGDFVCNIYNFCQELTNIMISHIQFTKGSSLEDLILKENIGESNFNRNPNDIMLDELIRSRFFPSGLLRNTNLHSQCSLIVPSGLRNREKWSKVLINRNSCEFITNRKSIISIMQTFSLNSITDIVLEQSIADNTLQKIQ